MTNKNFLITNENVEEYIKKISKWIKKTVKNAKADGVILGMSGGVDCSTVARLCQEAGVKTHLVILPFGNNMKDSDTLSHAMELINKFNFEYHIYDIKEAVETLVIPVEKDDLNVELARANIRPRMRMTYLYEYAGLNNLLVIGTGNLSEITVGYFTKWGDGAYDLNPIAYLTKKEVYILAKYLGVPECIINAKPSADLWNGQTDEKEMGITYEQIDNFILEGTTGNNEIDKKIKTRIEQNLHKVNPIPKFEI